MKSTKETPTSEMGSSSSQVEVRSRKLRKRSNDPIEAIVLFTIARKYKLSALISIVI